MPTSAGKASTSPITNAPATAVYSIHSRVRAKINKASERHEAARKTHDVAEKEKQTNPGMQRDVSKQRGGCRAKRMLARMRNDIPDQNDKCHYGGKQRDGREVRSKLVGRPCRRESVASRAPRSRQ